MRNLNGYLNNRKIDFSKLCEFGFVSKKNKYIYKEKICDNNFEVIIEIDTDKQISKVIDLDSMDEYSLVDVSGVGSFIGDVKNNYERIINDFIVCCTVSNIFMSKQAREIIKYVKDKYNTEFEYLWDKFPNNAICRRKDNKKWFGLILTVEEAKLGLLSNNMIEIVDLRFKKDELNNIIDNKCFFPGYHMNKNNWITIILDGSVNIDLIFKYIDSSFELANNKK